MTNRRTIHTASAPGTHPSYSSPGLHAFDCEKCGDPVEYTQRIDAQYQFHNEPVGFCDPVTGEDYCSACESEIYGEDDDE